jgi:putative transposase
MPRIGRVVVPGIPHHITQRGNRRQDVFFSREDRVQYLQWLLRYGEDHRVAGVGVLPDDEPYHLVGIPRTESSLGDTLRSLHMRHAQRVNARKRWEGHLWQGRFFSCALDEPHLVAAVRYVERNPVRAGMVKRAEDYEWSSAAAHAGLRDDAVLTDGLAFEGAIPDWRAWLAEQEREETLKRLRRRTAKGLPCGSESFVRWVERRMGVRLHDRPRGRPRKES